MKYVWTFNEDDWEDCNEPVETVEECIKQAKETNKKGTVVFVGEATKIIPKLDVEKALEVEEQDILAYVGLDIYDWELYSGKEEETEELEAEVNEVFKKWLIKYNHMPDFIHIINIKEFDI